MASRHMPDSVNAHPNVTPLIDVVMVLIVFFMLVAKIGVNTGADPNIIVPPSIQGIDIKDFGNSLVLNVTPGPLEQPMVTAVVDTEQTELKVIDPVTRQKQLMTTLQRFRYGNDFKPGGDRQNADNPDFNVILRAGEDLDYRFIEPVLIACAEAGVKEVRFNTAKVTEMAMAPEVP